MTQPNMDTPSLNPHSEKMIAHFFDAIEPWKESYPKARLSFVAIRKDKLLVILAARMHMAASYIAPLKSFFEAGDLVAGQMELPGGTRGFSDAIKNIISGAGHPIKERGRLVLRPEEGQNVSIGIPDLLHAEGLTSGNRIGVLTMTGCRRDMLTPQPQTDWILKAAVLPFDSLTELGVEYELGAVPHAHSIFEVVAHSSIEVWGQSTVNKDRAELGVWLAPGLDISMARLGYRVFDKMAVTQRNSVDGDALEWELALGGQVGRLSLDVPVGAIVQCYASFAGHAHNQRWIADPQTYQNARGAVLSSIDSSGKLLKAYALPDLSQKGKTSADDFESAVAWILWGLGFSPVSFGMNAKTRDAFDILATTPRGDFLAVECTLGLLRAESKLSKLGARENSLRDTLKASGLQHVRVLPVIITAMTREAVKADLMAASDAGILVLTREDIEAVFNNERLRFSNADQLFEQALKNLEDSKNPPLL
ncbi:hypothetical protein [Burkholderia gladioli]|uniref:hypothetical protein n=1 Tax=Burkholderia gladioli TaxID=28095 RepID=UPI00163E961D|nr:hypothetical protein [Burkholderia gladioli]